MRSPPSHSIRDEGLLVGEPFSTLAAFPRSQGKLAVGGIPPTCTSCARHLKHDVIIIIEMLRTV
jgi:hypothetical protein